MDVKNLIKESFTPEEVKNIRTAFDFSKSAHQGQKRKSGEPYFTHCYQTALQLAQWQMDSVTIAAGLLHDVVEDTKFSLEDFKKEFGEEIAFLVDGVTKIGRLKYRQNQNGKESLNAKRRLANSQAENIRKMILALSRDLRVVFIKLADRLHNMKTLSALPPQKQKRIAVETSEIYSPLAYRLGMSNLAGELEDLTFPYIHPQEYKWLNENIKEKYEERQKYSEKVKNIVSRKTISQEEVEQKWDACIKKIEHETPSLSFILKMAQLLKVEGHTIYLSVGYTFHQEKLMEKTIRHKLEVLFESVLDNKIKIEISVDEQARLPQQSEELQALASALGGEVIT